MCLKQLDYPRLLNKNMAFVHKTGSTQDSVTATLRTENFVTFGHVIFEICERTDRRTDTPITIDRTRRGAK